MILNKKLLPIAILSCFSSLTFAQGLLENNANLRADLNWLNQQGVIQLSTSTWPLSSEEVKRALENAEIKTPTQQKVLNAVQKNLEFEQSTLKLGFQAQPDVKDIPQGFAENRNAEYQGFMEFNADYENWDIKLRLNTEHNQIIKNGQEFNPEGTYIAGKIWNQWLGFGQIPTWWGPGHDGSLLRGDASRPVTGFTMQRAEQKAFENKWLSWIGSWQYQLFAGQLQDYQAIPDTKLLGMRLTLQPLPYFELGMSRTMQWGGKGRSESFSTLWGAIKGNEDNFTDRPDKSNQIAGMDFRLNLYPLLYTPVGVYGQFAGEDEAGWWPSKKFYLAGIDYSSSIRTMPYQLYAEWANTRTDIKEQGYTYTHSVYRDGFYQNGYPLAHAMGGDGEMYSIGGNIHIDPMNRIAARILQIDVNPLNQSINQAFPQKNKINAIDMTWTNTFRSDMSLKVNGWLTDSDLHGNDAGASIALEIALDKVLLGK